MQTLLLRWQLTWNNADYVFYIRLPGYQLVSVNYAVFCFYSDTLKKSEKLTEWLEEEEKNDDRASKPIHAHYREVSRIILKNCADSIKDVDQLSQLIEVHFIISIFIMQFKPLNDYVLQSINKRESNQIDDWISVCDICIICSVYT